ncbi:unnamed protein product [Paramecium sonneborni]|uniref:G domain-containing protein n=1 Tax=Paramecium sonneborni TaxID=65129 RepID=A0A8S1RCW3_9CILI|nr:unnamed protein product [Paramecium sonneborni]
MKQIDQKEQQFNEVGEEIITEIIQRVDNNFKKLNKFMQQYSDKQVILLCGNTGAGKSTLYNWLLGAKFEINEGYLEVIQTHEDMYVSKIGSTSTSITQTSIYAYIQELDHVLIDLPGFASTISDYHKLFIDVLFQKITESFNTKIVYVLDSSSKVLQNRGADFIQFIQSSLGNNQHSTQKINFIINQYNEDGSDEDQINRVRQQLSSRNEFKAGLPKNIQIVRKIKNQEMIDQVFSIKKKQDIIQSLIQSEPIKIQLQHVTQLSSSDIVNNYLMNKSTIYFKELKEKSLKIQEMIDNKHIFKITIPKKQEETNSDSSLPQTIESLYMLYTCLISNQPSDIKDDEDFQNFKKIFQYFLRYQSSFNCYFCLNSLENGEITRFNSIIDYLQKTQDKTQTSNMNKKLDQFQINPEIPDIEQIQKKQHKWIKIFEDVYYFVVIIAKTVLIITAKKE